MLATVTANHFWLLGSANCLLYCVFSIPTYASQPAFWQTKEDAHISSLLQLTYFQVQELGGTNRPGMADVFDYPDAEPSELFINPFACAVDPFMWRELQVQGLLFCTSVHCMSACAMCGVSLLCEISAGIFSGTVMREIKICRCT